MSENSYDSISIGWTKERNHSFISKLVEDFADKIIPEGHILDIGCGSGFLAKYLSERSFRVTGIDISKRMIDLAIAQKIPNCQFIHTDFFDFISPLKFDGVLAWDALFHFPKKRQKEIYSKVAHILNPGGYLLFSHGSTDGEHTDTMFGEEFYYSSLSRNELCASLKENRFTIEYVYEDHIENGMHRSLVVLAKKMSD